jgi:DNA helicase-2/ATP-dependent DNA helicase PcrA
MTGYDDETQKTIEAPVDRPVKIVAGAGTGKTWTLVQRFLWLTRPNGGGYEPSDILAITFTDKAAEEMRSRIRAALSREGRATETALNIHTFHSFGLRLLREYADDVSPDVKVLDEVQQRAVQRRLFRDVCEGRLEVDGLRAADVAALDVKKLKDFEGLCRTVISKGKGRGLSPEEFEHETTVREEDFWKALPDPETASAAGFGSELGDYLFHAISAKMPCRADPGKTRDSSDARGVYWDKLKNSRVDPPQIREGILERFGREQEATRSVLASAVAFWRAYDAELRRLGALDYDDLVNRAVSLLRNAPEVREQVRQKFKYLLVDEFQDTSWAQMELLRTVCVMQPCAAEVRAACGCRSELRPLNVTMVGDKKQAIYGWRNARKENMDDFVPCGHDETARSLSRSRRCRGMILQLANAIGNRVEPNDPVLAPLETEKSAEVHVPEPFKGDNMAEAREKQARYVAERIQWMVSADRGEKRVAYRDIAVLLRKASLFRELRTAFRERNIPYVFESAAGLLEEPCAKDIIAFLRAVATPHDDKAWYRLLSRPPVALCDADLVGLKAGRDDHFETTVAASPDTRVQELLTRVNTARRQAAEEALADFLRDLPVVSGLWDVWDRDDREVWPQFLAALQAVAKQAETLQAGAGAQDVVELLDTYADDDSLQMPTPPTEFAGVRVMTVHKAKGLEFDVVFVPGIASKERAETGWIWDEDWGLIPDFSSGDSVKRIFWKWLHRRDDREDEESRVWYVAATRAKESLTVTGAWRPTAKKNAKEGEDSLGEVIKQSTLPDDFAEDAVWALATHDPEPADWDGVPRRRVRPEEQEAAPVPTVSAAAALRSLKTSYSALTAMDACRVRAWLDFHWAWPEALLAPFDSTGRRRLGDLFHLAVARWYNGLRDGLADAVCSADEPEEVRRSLEGIWQAFLASEWKDVEPAAVERPVCWNVDVNGVSVEVRGFVDLLYRDADGRLVVCDFKTGVARSSHARQLCLYRMALLQEGEDVANEGVAVHPSPGEISEERFRLTDHEAAVREGLEEYLAVLTGGLPARPDGAPCDDCRYREACPRSSWEPSRAAGDEVVSNQDAGPFDEEWLPAVAALRQAGWEVEEPGEIRGKLPGLLARRGNVIVNVWRQGDAIPEVEGLQIAADPEDPAGLVARLEAMR